MQFISNASKFKRKIELKDKQNLHSRYFDKKMKNKK